MRYLVPCVIALVAATSVQAQPKSEARQQKVAVQFINGSHVVMSLLQDAIDVETQFGTLKITTSNLRFIDFGLHASPETEQEVKLALNKLSSSNYRDREMATAKLIELGPFSYMPLQDAAKNSELETAERIKDLIARIEQKFAAPQLRSTRDDQLFTTKFPVVGRVLTESIKAKAEYFGELELKPSQLLSIRWLEGAGQKELDIDAAKHGSAPDQWLDTGFVVESYLDLQIRASGKVDLCPQSPGDFVSGPNGMGGNDPNAMIVNNLRGAVAAQLSAGALMGRIGEKGTPFMVGERYHTRPTAAGRLYLSIVPGPYSNGAGSTGSYKAVVTSGYNLFP